MVMKHNHLAVITSVIAAFVVSYLWYSPPFFFDEWATGWGFDPATMEPAKATPYIVSLGGSLIGAYFLSWLIQRLGITNGIGGAGLAFMLWLAMVMPNIWWHYLFGGLPTDVAAIDAGNALLSGLTMGVILGAWRRT